MIFYKHFLKNFNFILRSNFNQNSGNDYLGKFIDWYTNIDKEIKLDWKLTLKEKEAFSKYLKDVVFADDKIEIHELSKWKLKDFINKEWWSSNEYFMLQKWWIEHLQKKLWINADWEYWLSTLKALLEFQKKNWITPDWIVWNKTLEILNNQNKKEKVEDLTEIKILNKLLDFISEAEWTDWNYNALYWMPNQKNLKFTNMTLEQVIKYSESHWKRTWSWAIWKYQFMSYTLEDMVKNYPWITKSSKFTPELQDKLAIYKLKERWLDDFKKNKNITEFQKNLAKEWASIPTPSWKSHYDWDSMNNKATTEWKEIKTILVELKKVYSNKSYA